MRRSEEGQHLPPNPLPKGKRLRAIALDAVPARKQKWWPPQLLFLDERGRGLGRRGSGAERQNRTADTVIFSHVLYQLSYLGIVPIQLYHRPIFGAGSLPCKRQAPLWSPRCGGGRTTDHYLRRKRHLDGRQRVFIRVA